MEKKNKFRNPAPSSIDQNAIEEHPFAEYEKAKQTMEPPSPEGVMASKKNKEKKAAPREKEPKTEKAKPTDKKQGISLNQRLQQAIAIYQNERTQKILGLTLILAAAYLCIALVSYFFTWDVDQDKIMGQQTDLLNPETKIQNWLGKAGAWISHLCMYKGFGAASFVLVPVIALLGLQKLVRKQLVNVQAFHAKWLFLMVWGSMLTAYLFSDVYYFLGGGFGHVVNSWISNLVGNIGLIALIVFSMLAFLVLSINLNFSLPKKPVIEDDESIQNELNTSPVAEEKFAGNDKGFNASFNEPKTLDLTPEEEAALLEFEVIKKPMEAETEEKPVTPPLTVTPPVAGFEIVMPVQEEVIQKTTEEQTPEPPVQELNLNDLSIELPTQINSVISNKTKEETDFQINESPEEPVIEEEENKAAKLVEQFGEYDPTLDLGSYTFPNFDLLNDYGNTHSKVNQEELIANKDRIVATLKNYGIEIDKISATVGPTVTLYEIVPAAGVRISKIKNLEDDIALSLAALGIRIIAPIPGKGTIGIEVPNQNAEIVPMKNILASEKFNNSTFELPIALGKTISNEIFIADLAKMPHLLMAGATGQGKSVGLNAVLVSLLYKKHPAQVKFVLVDPKKVELTLFNKIERHFLAKLPNSEDAIITDNTKVIHTLNSLCIEMDNRYALLQDAQCRNIKEYNTKFIARKLNPNEGHKYLPYIVLVVDEFADLIMTAGKEVETPIARLAQLARAIGIHLIIATQRPSVNIITGTIKANFPARIAFRVTSKIDSRTILDAGGAEQLIGRGDMLLSTGNDLIRIQCAFVDTPEVEKITEFIGNQRAYPSAFLLPEYVGEDGESGKEEIDLSERDKMFDEAAKLVVQFQQGSASFLQRKLKLGYNRAGRIVDQLEAAGIIGPFEGSKAREVLVRDMMQLDEILQRIKNS
ncbi:MAG: DNA translocase FtsK [Sediminibacterium sp.]|nr:DNA translocase FtsK [Sediminibacterium sp.]